MKIEPGRGVSTGSGGRANAAAAPGFSPTADAPQRVAASTPSSAVTPLDALIALQGEDPPARRRARQLKRGGAALEALEELERGLVLGRAPADLRARLEAAGRGGEATDDAGLDALMLEIDTRLAVEAAKLERALIQA